MVEVGQLRRRCRVFHDFPDFVADEFCSRVVRFLVDQQIAECGAESQAAGFPGRFVQGLPFLGGRLQGGAIGDEPWVAVDARLRYLSNLGGILLDVALERRRERAIAGRHAVVRRTLENGQMRGSFGDHRRRLDAGRAGADQPNALAAEIDAFVRPLPGVDPASLEGVEAGNVRDIGRRQAADRGDQELRREYVARLSGHAPDIRQRIVMGGGHAGIEADVALQVEALSNVVEISQDFRRAGIAFRPFPLPHQFLGERIAVGMAFRIAARTGIAVPVPGAADSVGHVQHLDR